MSRKTIYDHRTAVNNAVRDAAPRLYHALKDLLDAVEERHDRAGIESATINEAHSALLSANIKSPPEVVKT